MLIHIFWQRPTPLPAYIVRHVRAWKQRGHPTLLWTDGLLKNKKWSKEDVTDNMGGVVMDGRIEPVSFTLYTEDVPRSAVAIFTDAPMPHTLDYAELNGYTCTTLGYTPSVGAPQPTPNGDPIGPNVNARITPPPRLAQHEFVLYVAPTARADLDQLNDHVAAMLNTNAVVGVRHHVLCFPSIHEQFTFRYAPTSPEWKTKTADYIASRVACGFKRGGDGSAAVFDTDLVLRDMRHAEANNMNEAWGKEQSYTDSPHISFFFVRQMLVSAVHILPPRFDLNCLHHIHDRVHVHTTLPLSPPASAPALIPPKLHIIWLGPVPPAEFCIQNFESWKRVLPHWDVKLWRNGDEAEFGPDVQARIERAQKGAQKADILRAFILEKYGGFYMDADVQPVKSLDVLRFIGEPVILCHDLPLTWAYISTGFFGTVPHHPLFQAYCTHIMSDHVVLNTANVHMQTGPRALGFVVAKVPPPKGGRYYMLPSKAFYYNGALQDCYGRHTYANSWA
jgi:hypothetical protein